MIRCFRIIARRTMRLVYKVFFNQLANNTVHALFDSDYVVAYAGFKRCLLMCQM